MPFDAVEVDAQRHRHAALRHRMMEVVRKYNQASCHWGHIFSTRVNGRTLRMTNPWLLLW